MREAIESIYRNGVFVPEKAFSLPEGARVKIVIELIEETSNSNWSAQEPMLTESEKRKKTMAEFLKRTGSRTISPKAPQNFTREELHERC